MRRLKEHIIQQIEEQRHEKENEKEKKILRGGESNPGFPRDRRGY